MRVYVAAKAEYDVEAPKPDGKEVTEKKEEAGDEGEKDREVLTDQRWSGTP